MVNNEMFKRDLDICYLSLLANSNCREEFEQRYETVEPIIYSDIDGIVDPHLLQSLKTVIDYKKSLEKGMSK